MVYRGVEYTVGQRVCREEAPEQVGTVTEVKASEIKVEWDNGGVSFYQISGYVPLNNAPR